ncbi:hypothetical protein ACFL6C_11900, partial [Myxococcota bacterium]
MTKIHPYRSTVGKSWDVETVPMPTVPDFGQARSKPLPKVTSVPSVQRVTECAKTIRFDNLLESLTYGASGVVDAIIEEVRAGSPLAQALLEPPASLTDRPRTNSLPDANSLRETLTAEDVTYFDTTRRHGQTMAVLCRFLWQFRDAQGALHLEGVLQGFGAAAAGLVSRLADAVNEVRPRRPDYHLMAEVVEQIQELVPQGQARDLVDALVRHDGLIPERLQVLDRAMQEVPDGRLNDNGLCGALHLFPTSVPLLEALVAKGMRPEDIHVSGTPYASNALVAAYCRMLGMDVRAEYPVALPTGAHQRSRLRDQYDLLQRVADLPPPPGGWVVADDGGMLHVAVSGAKRHLLRYRQDLAEIIDATAEQVQRMLAQGPVRGSEQTARGLTELHNLEAHDIPLPYSVVTLGDAPVKKDHEAPYIGWSLANSLREELWHRGLTDDRVKRITLVGAGSVGFEAALHLKAGGFQVTVVDPDNKVQARAADHHMPAQSQ